MATSSIKSQMSLIFPEKLSFSDVFAFNSQVTQALGKGMKEVLIDCSKLEQVSSSHIGLLWSTLEDCRRMEATIVLKNPTKALTRVLEMLDIAEIFGTSTTTKSDDSDVANSITYDERELSYSDSINVSDNGLQKGIQNFVSFLKKLNVPSKKEFELRTIFYEVFTNIRNHSGLDDSSKLSLIVSVNNTNITLVFKDTGIAFDPTQHQGITDFVSGAQDRKIKGFGLLMIQKLVNKISYERVNNDTNRLILEMNWKHTGG